MALVRNSSSTSSRNDTISSMTAKRTRTLAKQQQISENIANIANVLLENAQESVSAIEELKSSMEQIATAAEENSGSSEQALKFVNEITNNINNMTRTIDNGITVTLNVGNNITGAVEATSNTVNRMQASVKIAKDSSKKSEELKVSSQNIGEAVSLIAKIADQTNLLALNAAIEAHRAKEHGKGFAVVADETRSLSGNSEKNAKFITDLVNQIQQSIDTIIGSITGTTAIIEQTGNDGNNLTVTLEELVKITNYTVEAARNAGNFTTQLVKYASEMSSGTESIAMASSQIAAAVERTLNSIEMQTKALSLVEDDVKELVDSAEELKTSTDTVKSAEEIAASADGISSAVEEIRKSMNEVTRALSDIENSSKTTNDNAIANKNKAQMGLAISKDMDQIITLVRRNMDILKTSFVKVKERLQGIRLHFESSINQGEIASSNLGVIRREAKNVAKTVTSISNIILQLNMLAISGSIESARAGEFGKGFAVVSADIRNLSQDAEANIDKINDVVESMHTEIDNVNNDWQNLLKGQEYEKSTIDSLINEVDKIVDQLIDILDRYQGLKSINDQNMDGLSQALNGIEEIQKAIELSATNAMESKKAADLIIDTISHMADSVEELAAMADELQQG